MAGYLKTCSLQLPLMCFMSFDKFQPVGKINKGLFEIGVKGNA